jgi:hypothetical protein
MDYPDLAEWSEDRVRAHINALESRVLALNSHVNECSRKHSEDIAKIGEHLIREARKREWCDVYDDFVDNLNTFLHIKLPARRKMHRMKMEFTVTVERLFEAQPGEDANAECCRLEQAFRGLEHYIEEPAHWDMTIEQTSTNYDLED